MHNNQQVITACAFIYHYFDGIPKLFLPQRAATKKFLPNVFELPGGHIEFGEDIIDGLKREIVEEFGMTIDVGEPFAVFTYTNYDSKAHAIEVIYFATFVEPIEEIKLNPTDHSTYKWFAQEDIPGLIDNGKPASDLEISAIYKGFSRLTGGQ